MAGLVNEKRIPVRLARISICSFLLPKKNPYAFGNPVQSCPYGNQVY